MCGEAIHLARSRKIPVIVDPANIGDYSKYAGATALKLNRSEAERAANLPVRKEEHYAPAADLLLKKLNLEAVIITLDKSGAYLATSSGEHRHLQTRERLARPAAANDATGDR